MEQRLGFVIDLAKCLGCRSCELACYNNHSWETPFRYLREFYQKDKGRLIYSKYSYGCNHCEEPECIIACPEKSYYKKQNGIVLHNTTKCSGCGDCIRACPFGAPQYNSSLGVVDKCDMCVSRLGKGLDPYCVEICPVNAIKIGDFKQIKEERFAKECLGFTSVDLTRPAIRFKKMDSQK